eukprot:7269485-Prymnesium_polylepis.1
MLVAGTAVQLEHATRLVQRIVAPLQMAPPPHVALPQVAPAPATPAPLQSHRSAVMAAVLAAPPTSAEDPSCRTRRAEDPPSTFAGAGAGGSIDQGSRLARPAGSARLGSGSAVGDVVRVVDASGEDASEEATQRLCSHNGRRYLGCVGEVIRVDRQVEVRFASGARVKVNRNEVQVVPSSELPASSELSPETAVVSAPASDAPSPAPSPAPSLAPSLAPAPAPSLAPSLAPSPAPSLPTAAPTVLPTALSPLHDDQGAGHHVVRARSFSADDVPTQFLCPITHALMVDPVFTADGHSYERCMIAAWLESHDTSPLTNEPLAHKHLTPNVALRALIQERALPRPPPQPAPPQPAASQPGPLLSQPGPSP